jgi:hypothetical protein
VYGLQQEKIKQNINTLKNLKGLDCEGLVEVRIKMIKYRTISDLLKIFILPEVEKRIKNGIVKGIDLPIELHLFRIIQKKLSEGNALTIVELNKEVNFLVETKAKKAFAPGDRVTLDDIYPDECFIRPPVYDGKPTAYFLCQSFIFDYFLCFDLSPNLPGITVEELKTVQIQYPISEFSRTLKIWEIVKPIEKLKLLTNNNWPPAPGYYPQTLLHLHKDPTQIKDETFLEVVANSFDRDYWVRKLAFWEETKFFPKRIQYIKRAIDAHFQEDFICSIYVIVPQFEGIVRDYLTQCHEKPPKKFLACVNKLKELILSRKILLFKREILENIFQYLETGSFWKKTTVIQDAGDRINRHGVAHGIFTGFECKGVSLKYLILLDSLAFLLLHDKMVTHSL